MQTDVLNLVLATLALAGVAVAVTAMLRVGGIGARSVGPGGYRGTAIVGGIVAGVLLGPGVLGQVKPSWHRAAFLGGGEQVEALEVIVLRQRTDIRALEEAGVTPVAIEELESEHASARDAAIGELRDAEAERRARIDAIAAGLACVCVFAACACAVPSSRRARRRFFRALRPGAARHARKAIVYLVIGTGVPAAVTYVFALRDVRFALAFGLIIGAAGVSGALGAWRRWQAHFASVVCGIVAVAVAPTWIASLVFASGVIGLVAGGVSSRAFKRRAVWAVRWVALPLLVALLAVRVDLARASVLPLFWYLLIVAVVWCSDGRWFASWASVRSDRAMRWTRASALVDAGSGTATVVLALIFVSAGVVGEAVLVAAIASAAVVELFRGFRAFAGPVLDG